MIHVLCTAHSCVAQLAEHPTVNRTVTGSSPVAGAIQKIPLETRGFFHFQRLLAFLATLHVYPSAEAVVRPAVHAYDERIGSIKQRKEVHHVHWRSFLRRRGKHVFRPQPRLELLIRRKHPATPRGYHYDNVFGASGKATPNAVIGVGVVMADRPMYFDCANEHGLAIAGLNFPATRSSCMSRSKAPTTSRPSNSRCGWHAISIPSTKSRRR